MWFLSVLNKKLRFSLIIKYELPADTRCRAKYYKYHMKKLTKLLSLLGLASFMSLSIGCGGGDAGADAPVEDASEIEDYPEDPQASDSTE